MRPGTAPPSVAFGDISPSRGEKNWRIVSPAPASAVLELASPVARIRRLTLAQARGADTAAVFLGQQPMAVAMFARHGWRRVEMALAIAPAAAPHMRKLIRMAQLTLLQMADSCLVVADVRSVAGARMAAAAGFSPARLKSKTLWVFRHGYTVRRRQEPEAGGRARPAAAAGRE